ncbi:MAG: hypothetical protein MUF81_12300 [Verrucomicrobia bacterium]|nr:hypothetical protein [Verrucomicrobiota bacterium]
MSCPRRRLVEVGRVTPPAVLALRRGRCAPFMLIEVGRVTPCAPFPFAPFVWRSALRTSHPVRGGQRTARPTLRERR